MRPNCFLIIALLVHVPFVTAAEALAISIWPGQAPGETETFPPEANITGPDGRKVDGRSIIRIGNVVEPTITVYRPDREIDTGAAILVCPGGGYRYVAIDIEGTEVCDWLNSIGVTGIVLKYRVPRRESVPYKLPPLQDAQRAMGIIRGHAAEWGIDPSRIGVLGFSAGGHLAAHLGNNHEHRQYPPMDAFDDVSCRPDFCVLIYPGDLVVKEEDNAISPELSISAERTPPTFLVMTQDDPVGIENAIYYFAALQRAGVPAEMHLYPTGGHGYGLRTAVDKVVTWPDRVADWMEASGWLKPPQNGTQRSN